LDLDGPIPGYQLKGCAQDVTAPMPPQIPASGWAREHTHTHTVNPRASPCVCFQWLWTLYRVLGD
jgi:hypothetical protein